MRAVSAAFCAPYDIWSFSKRLKPTMTASQSPAAACPQKRRTESVFFAAASVRTSSFASG